MMNRREFLTVFGFAIPAVVLVPAAALDAFEAGAPVELPELGGYKSVAWNGPPMITAMYWNGTASESIVAHCGLRRGDWKLVDFALNGFGGAGRWIPPFGAEIIVIDSRPVEVWTEGPVEAAALMRLPGIERYQLLTP